VDIILCICIKWYLKGSGCRTGFCICRIGRVAKDAMGWYLCERMGVFAPIGLIAWHSLLYAGAQHLTVAIPRPPAIRLPMIIHTALLNMVVGIAAGVNLQLLKAYMLHHISSVPSQVARSCICGCADSCA
jgi:hypothetical protein